MPKVMVRHPLALTDGPKKEVAAVSEQATLLLSGPVCVAVVPAPASTVSGQPFPTMAGSGIVAAESDIYVLGNTPPIAPPNGYEVTNNGTDTLYVNDGDGASSTSGVPLAPGETYVSPLGWTPGPVRLWTATAGHATIRQW